MPTISFKEQQNRKEVTANRAYPRIEIKTDDDYPQLVHIFVDGHEIKGIREYSLTQSIGEIPCLHIDINALDLTVDQAQAALGIKGVSNVKALTFDNDITVAL